MKTQDAQIFFLLLTLLIISFGGCRPILPEQADPLTGSDWTLLYYRKSSPIPGTEMTISFQDGTFQGSAGCNSYGGSYQIDGETFTTRDIYSTEMYCMDPEGIMDQESYFLESLQVAVRYKIEGDRLIIHRPGQDTLTFQRK